MALADHLTQRPAQTDVPINITTRRPSGPQTAANRLEADLVTALSFSPYVLDIVTRPVLAETIDGRDLVLVPAVLVHVYGSRTAPLYWFFDIDRAPGSDLTYAVVPAADRAAAAWRAKHATTHPFSADSRIISEREIRTPYTENATRLIARLRAYDDDDPALAAAIQFVTDAPRSVQELLSCLQEQGFSPDKARETVEIIAVNGFADCDFSQPFADATILSKPRRSFDPRPEHDPFFSQFARVK